jgi:hypothetical protein
VVWDLRYPPAPGGRRFGGEGGGGGTPHPLASTQARIPGDFGGGGDPRTQDRAGNGPTVLPGRYTVTLRAGSTTSKGVLEVDGDPRVTISDEDRLAQHQFLMTAYEAQLMAGKATARVTAIEKQADDIGKALASAKPAHADVTQAVTTFTQAMRDVQGGVARAAGALGGLSRNVSRSTSRPTPDQDQALADAQAALKTALAALDQAVATKVPMINRQLEAAGLAGRIRAGRASDMKAQLNGLQNSRRINVSRQDDADGSDHETAADIEDRVFLDQHR